jgi:hypothetical protein
MVTEIYIDNNEEKTARGFLRKNKEEDIQSMTGESSRN